MSDSVSLNTDSSHEASLCSPEKERNTSITSKIRFGKSYTITIFGILDVIAEELKFVLEI